MKIRLLFFTEKHQVFVLIFKWTPKVPAWFLIINLWKNKMKEVLGEKKKNTWISPASFIHLLSSYLEITQELIYTQHSWAMPVTSTT